MYLLYRFKTDRKFPYNMEGCSFIETGIFSRDCHISLYNKIVVVLWKILTFNKTWLFCVNSDNVEVHMSLCIGKNFKFPFMGSSDVQIGSCETIEKYRGRGIYPYVINRIAKEFTNRGYKNIYMVVEEGNKSSIHGIEKAGFEKISELTRVGKLKIYRIIENCDRKDTT